MFLLGILFVLIFINFLYFGSKAKQIDFECSVKLFMDQNLGPQC